MINDNTILSSFNDRPTLLEWLKKVEEALKSDTATGVSVENPSVNNYIFKITFADGKTIASDTIRFPDSVKGASILNNHLVLTMQSGITDDLGVINPYADTIVLNSVSNTTEIGNDMSVAGNFKVNSNITCNGLLRVNGTSQESSSIEAQTIYAFNELYSQGRLVADGNLEVGGNSEFSGSATFLNELYINGGPVIFNGKTIPNVPEDNYQKDYFLYCQRGSFKWGTSILIPPLPNDAYMKTYVLKAVNGTLTWVEG